MALNIRRFLTGIQLIGQSTVTPTVAGEMRYNSSTNQLEVFHTGLDQIITASASQVLTTKTIAVGSNTITSTANSVLITSAGGVATPLTGSQGQVLSFVGGIPTATLLQQGAKNYITYNNFENNATTGWSLAHTSIASLLPTSVASPGTAFDSTHGGTAASGNLSIAIIDSGSQLAGTYSLSASSSAVSTAGDIIISQAYTIDLEDQAKVMTIKYYFKAAAGSSNCNFSGTSSNTFQTYIYDVTNGAWIQPAGVYGQTQGSGVGYTTGTFQTPSNMTQFQIAIVNVNASSGGGFQMLYDDFYVGPQTAPYGPVMTDWTSYPPTGTWSSNTTYTGWLRRVGDTQYNRVHIALSGAPTAAILKINLPSGISFDTSKITLTADNTILGAKVNINRGGSQYFGIIQYSSATQIDVSELQTDTGSNPKPINFGQGVNATNPGTFANGDYIDLEFSYPVSGWSSNVQLSNDTDTRILVANYTMSGASAVTSINSASQTTLDFNISQFDTAGAVTTGASWKYTVPVAGFYKMYASVTFNSASWGQGVQVELDTAKNGTSTSVNEYLVAATYTGELNVIGYNIFKCIAGDTLSFQIFQNSGGARTINTGRCTAIIERLSGPAVVAATETVAARYTQSGGSATTSISTATVTTVDMNVKTFDTHNVTTTGASWRWTAPTTGYVRVAANITFNSGVFTAGNQLELSFFKNGSAYSFNEHIVEATITGEIGVAHSDLIQVVAGDYIYMTIYQNTGGARTLNTARSFLSINMCR